MKSLDDVDKMLSPNEYIKFRIYDRVKVLVETTTEFPLDIKCTILFT